MSAAVLKEKLRQRLFTAAIKAAILDVPEAIKLIQREYAKTMSTQFYKSMVQAYRELPSLFPTSGVIRKAHNYGYLDLGPVANNYIDATLRLMSWYDMLGKLQTKKARLVVPPSPIGAHISLHNVHNSDVGKTLHFELEYIQHFPDERQGKKASGFNPHVYPLHWFVLNVRGIPQKFIGYDRPHISIALLAYVI